MNRTTTSNTGFGLYVVYIIIAPFATLFEGIMNSLAILLFVLSTIYILQKRKLELSYSHTIILAILTLSLVWYLISVSASVEPVANLIGGKTLLLYTVIIFSGIVLVDSKQRVSVALLTIAAITSIIGYLTIIHLIFELPFGGAFRQARSFGPLSFGFPRTLAAPTQYDAFTMYILIGLPTLFVSTLRPSSLSLPQHWITKMGSLIGIVGTLAAVIIMQSRSAYVVIAICVVLFLTILLIQQTGYNFLRLGILCSIPAILLMAIFGQEILQAYISTNSKSVYIRLQLYLYAGEMIVENLALGCGWDCTSAIVNAGQKGNSPRIHNFWLLIGASYGLPLLLSWSMLFLQLIYNSISALQLDSSKYWLGLIALTALSGGILQLSLFPAISDEVGVYVSVIVCIFGISTFTYCTS